jgi:hypothetical protein
MYVCLQLEIIFFEYFSVNNKIIDNQIIQYNRLSLVINNIVTFKPWIGDNFTKML